MPEYFIGTNGRHFVKSYFSAERDNQDVVPEIAGLLVPLPGNYVRAMSLKSSSWGKRYLRYAALPVIPVKPA